MPVDRATTRKHQVAVDNWSAAATADRCKRLIANPPHLSGIRG